MRAILLLILLSGVACSITIDRTEVEHPTDQAQLARPPETVREIIKGIIYLTSQGAFMIEHQGIDLEGKIISVEFYST